MEYKEALKLVQTKKSKDSYLVIKFAYDVQIVFPYKEGVAVVEAFKNAEQLHTPYNDKHRINELSRNAIETTLMSGDEYERFKIAALLGVTPDEVKEYALKAA